MVFCIRLFKDGKVSRDCCGFNVEITGDDKAFADGGERHDPEILRFVDDLEGFERLSFMDMEDFEGAFHKSLIAIRYTRYAYRGHRFAVRGSRYVLRWILGWFFLCLGCLKSDDGTVPADGSPNKDTDNRVIQDVFLPRKKPVGYKDTHINEQ